MFAFPKRPRSSKVRTKKNLKFDNPRIWHCAWHLEDVQYTGCWIAISAFSWLRWMLYKTCKSLKSTWALTYCQTNSAELWPLTPSLEKGSVWRRLSCSEVQKGEGVLVIGLLQTLEGRRMPSLQHFPVILKWFIDSQLICTYDNHIGLSIRVGLLCMPLKKDLMQVQIKNGRDTLN